MAKIIFIQRMAIEYFGLEILSAVLKKSGHQAEVRILNVDGEKSILGYIQEYKPDLIGFSLMNVDFLWALELAKKIKQQNQTKVIIGGPMPTFFPEMAIGYPVVDYICIGEGEYALLELMNVIDKKSDDKHIKNIWVKKDNKVHKNEIRPLVANLDKLPFFDRDIYFKRYKLISEFSAKRFMVDRGCPYNCSYCFNHKLRAMYAGKGPYLRIQSPERAIEEIEHVIKNYDTKLVSFSNDSLTWNKEWLFKFLKLYKKRIKLPFTMQCRFNELTNEIAKALAEAGCYSAFCGVESGSERVRREILNRNMTNEQIIEGAGLLKKYNIKLLSANMFGMPTETLEEAFETVELNLKIKSDTTSSSIFQPIPGTRSYEIAKEKGLFRKDYDISKAQTQFGGSSLNQKDIDKMINLQRLLYFIVKYPSLWPLIKRMINYNLPFIYKPIWALGYGLKYMESRQISFFEAIKQGWSMRQAYMKIK